MSSFLLRTVTVRFLAVGAVLALGLCDAVCGANPGSREPMNPLEIHNLTNGQPLLATADGLFTALLKDIQAISANPSRVAGKKLSDLHAQIRQLRRAALDLQLLGETAGVDYSFRADVLNERLGVIIQAFKGTPAGQAYTNQIRQALLNPKAVQARKVGVQKLQKMLQDKQLEEAYTLLHRGFDQLTSLTMMLPDSEAAVCLLEFAPVSDPITRGRITAFREQAQAALNQLAASLLPKTQELVQRVADAASALRTAPQATVDGQALSGPQCLEAFGAAWKQVHLSAIRCRAVDWAYMTGIPNEPSLEQTGTPRIAEADFERFYDELVKALASLIEADAQRAAEADARTLYLQYLPVLAPLVAATRDDKLALAVQPALDKLAAKSPALAKEIATYVAATHELLRWRERTAQAQAASAAAAMLPSDQAVVKFFLSEGDYRGLLTPVILDFVHAVLRASAPEVIPTASQRALEQSVVVNDIVGLSGGKLGVARYKSRHYATLTLPEASDELARLQQDLMVTAEQPALSLESVVALEAARQGNYVAAGGAVKGFYLEGLIPRFAALRPEAQQLVALGPLPAEVPPVGFLSHVLVRLDVAPAWVQHKYFFLPLAEPAASEKSP